MTKGRFFESIVSIRSHHYDPLAKGYVFVLDRECDGWKVHVACARIPPQRKATTSIATNIVSVSRNWTAVEATIPRTV